jgi:protein O-GlcNAc transferase
LIRASSRFWRRFTRRAAFAGLVAASLLSAVVLPELVTHSLEEYEVLALKLATDPPRHRSIQRTLEVNRFTHPLFNADRFRRHIEVAYTTMWEKRGSAAKRRRASASIRFSHKFRDGS